MITDFTIPVTGLSGKKEFKKEVADKIEHALPDIKQMLGEKKFDKRLKKAVKLLLQGIKTDEPASDTVKKTKTVKKARTAKMSPAPPAAAPKKRGAPKKAKAAKQAKTAKPVAGKRGRPKKATS